MIKQKILNILILSLLSIIALNSCDTKVKTTNNNEIVLSNLDSISTMLYQNLSRNRKTGLNEDLSFLKKTITALAEKTSTDSAAVLKDIQEFYKSNYLWADNAMEKIEKIIISILNEKDSLQKKILIKTFEIMTLEDMINNYYSGMIIDTWYSPVAFKKKDSVYVYLAVINPFLDYRGELLLGRYDDRKREFISIPDTNFHFKKGSDYYVSKVQSDVSKLEGCLRFLRPDSTYDYYPVNLNLKDN